MMPARAISLSRSFSSRDQDAMRFRESGAIMISSTLRRRVPAHIAPQQRSPTPFQPAPTGSPARTYPKVSDQLSGTRHFNLTLSTMEDHLAATAGWIGGRV